MQQLQNYFLFLIASVLLTVSFSLAQGSAYGTLRFGDTQTLLRYATQSAAGAENVSDTSKRDRIIVLSDNPIPPTVGAEDSLGLSLVTRSGSFSFLMLRFDGPTLVNVKVGTPKQSGLVVIAGKLFKSKMSSESAGALFLEPKEIDGVIIASSVTFTAEMGKMAHRVLPTLVASPDPTPTIDPAANSKVSIKIATTLFLAAVMSKDEHQALELIKLGIDPNGIDQNGVPVLNWAVMMCQPTVVDALIKAGSSLTYERLPGVTILTEAGACPAAATILKEAGAR